MFNLLNIRNSKRGYSIFDTKAPSPLIPLRRRGKLCAFTLAEVLITLVIIGVIAAITVPTLITKYQKEQTVTRLKKAYSALAQTTQRAIADNGPIETWEIGNAKIFFNKYINPYVSLSKKAEWLNDGNWNSEFYNLNGVQENYSNSYARAYFTDGTSVTLGVNSNNDTNKILILKIDINGDKKPNKQGKDIFEYIYYILTPKINYLGKLIPSGQEYSRDIIISNLGPWNCNKEKTGAYCATLIMKDGWQIADDYPW